MPLAPSAGPEARTAVLDAPASAADSAAPSSSSADTDAPEVDGRKAAREILRGMMGKKKAAEEPADETAGPEETDGETTPTTADAEKPAEKTPDAKTAGDAAQSEARDALIRDGWTSADLDKLAPERIVSLGERARSRQKQQDGFGRQKSEEITALKAKLAELEGSANQPPATQGKTPPAAATQDPFADPEFSEIGTALDSLGDVASPEVKEVVKNAMAKLVQIMDGRHGQKVDTLTALASQQMEKAARVVVAKDFPGIEDDAKFKTVQQKMQVLAKTGAYGPGDMDTLMKDACKLTLPAASIQDVQRKMLEQSQKAQDGQMDAGQRSRAAGDKTPMTEEDKNRKILRLMKGGKSADEARRAVTG